MNNGMQKAKDDMFAHAEDPKKSKWWDVAWDVLHDQKYGATINTMTTQVEEALWLLELRNIHCAFECTYYSWSYDPQWTDWWETTGISTAVLAEFLQVNDNSEGADTFQDAIHRYCWEKREAIYNALMLRFEQNDALLYNLFMGGKDLRDRDKALRIFSWIGDEFSL